MELRRSGNEQRRKGRLRERTLQRKQIVEGNNTSSETTKLCPSIVYDSLATTLSSGQGGLSG